MPHNIYADPYSRNLYVPLQPATNVPPHAVGSESPLQLAAQRREVSWVFTDLASAPTWVDRNWASCIGEQPTLSIPTDFSEKRTATYLTVRVGDTLCYEPPAKGSGDLFGKFFVIPAEPSAPPAEQEQQSSGASMEDALLNGALHISDLAPDARAQLEDRLAHRMGELEASRFMTYLRQRPKA